MRYLPHDIVCLWTSSIWSFAGAHWTLCVGIPRTHVHKLSGPLIQTRYLWSVPQKLCAWTTVCEHHAGFSLDPQHTEGWLLVWYRQESLRHHDVSSFFQCIAPQTRFACSWVWVWTRFWTWTNRRRRSTLRSTRSWWVTFQLSQHILGDFRRLHHRWTPLNLSDRNVVSCWK